MNITGPKLDFERIARKRINPRHILVTGAGSGIGREIAFHLASRDALVIGTVRDPERASRLSEEAQNQGLSITYLPLELTRPEQIEALGRDLDRLGGIDVLVHNAGFGLFGAVEDCGQEAMQRQFEVNLMGPLALTRRLLPGLRARQGRIIWIGSLGGRFALPFQACYSASKAAVATVSDALRMELRPFGVKVTCIEAADFATDFTRARQDCTQAGSPYARWAERCLAAVTLTEQRGPAPRLVARRVDKLLQRAYPPARVRVGRWARTLCFLERVIPDLVREQLVRATYRL